MAIVYFDSSAFVKLLVEEDGTDLAVRLWDACDAAVSSRLAYPEVRAALAAAARTNRIDPGRLTGVERTWEEYWRSVRLVELTESVANRAGRLCRELGLRGADGVHLASALVFGDADLVMAVWDTRLATGAVATNVSVAPAPVSG